MKISKILILLPSLLAGPQAASAGSWDVPEGSKTRQPVAITVYRSPSCQCCGRWLAHLQQHGFKVEDQLTENMDAIKAQYHVPRDLQSCHTAVSKGFVVEGHVPAGDILKLLKDQPGNLAGLTVPAMPVGTPGMEMGGRKDPFDVKSFDRDGKAAGYHHYESY